MDNFITVFLLVCLIILMVATFLSVMWLWSLWKTGVPHIPTSWRMARVLVGLAEEQLGDLKDKNITDLGCGGGRILKKAKQKGAQVVGYELDLYGRLYCKIRRIKCHNTDFFKEDFAEFDVIYAYLFPELMERVEKEIWAKMKPGQIMIAHQFALPSVKPSKTWQKGWKKAHVYVK